MAPEPRLSSVQFFLSRVTTALARELKSGDLAGSWHPYKPVPDRWGSFGGRIYVTTMNLLSLEVRHRMLPIYRGEEPSRTAEVPINE